MSGRGLTNLFRCSDCAVRSGSRGLPIQRRTFTSSSAWRKHGGVPIFSDVSSPELQELLSNLREKLIMPAYLGKKQKDLVYKPKYQKVLATEPVIATIAGEDFTLSHVDKRKDVPSGKRALYDALDLMKEKKDWDNLPNLLQGLQSAGLKLNSLAINVKIARKAGQAGRVDVVLECLRRVSDTGLALKDPEFVVQVMLWIQAKAVESNWWADHTRQALSWAEMVVVMMEDPKHAGDRKLNGENDPRLQPEVIGILLELAAVRAARHLSGTDKDGKVAEYAERLLGTPLEFKTPGGEAEYDINPWLWTHAPVLHGMKVAQTILDPASKLAVELKEKSEELEKIVSTNKDILSSLAASKGKQLHGLELYEKLLGSESL